MPNDGLNADIIERVALGLEYAHQKGIVHRDLSPDNILFDNHNNPYITDFSLAKLIADTFRTNSGNGFIGRLNTSALNRRRACLSITAPIFTGWV